MMSVRYQSWKETIEFWIRRAGVLTYVLRTSFNFYPNVCPFLLKSCHRRRRHRRLRSSTSVTAAAARLLLSTKRPKLVWSRIKNRNILNSQLIQVLWCSGRRKKHHKTRINWLFDSSLQLSLSKISLETKSWDIQTIRSWKEYLLNLLKTT